jgi:hypothetical protein
MKTAVKRQEVALDSTQNILRKNHAKSDNQK